MRSFSYVSQRLLNKVAAVTGASSGLGRAIKLTYPAEDAAVICADLDPVAKAPAKEGDVTPTYEVIGERGGKSIFVRWDVRDSRDVQSALYQSMRPRTRNLI